MPDTILEHTQAIAELLGLPAATGQGDPVITLLAAIRSYLAVGGGGGGGGGGGVSNADLTALDNRKLEKKTVYADTSWEWWRSEADGGGHWSWEFTSGILRFSRFNNAPGSPIVFEEGAILGGGPDFVTTGGSRIGHRLIVAWDGGGRGIGDLRTYYTVGRANSVFSTTDEITTQQWVKAFLASEQGVPRSPVAVHADIALIANPKSGDWVSVDDDTPIHSGERWIYTFNGLTWTALFKLANPSGIADGEVTDAKIGTRALEDLAADDALVPVAAKSLTAWLQGFRDNLKALFSGKVSTSGDTMSGNLDMGGNGIAGIGVMDANALITTLVKEKVSGEGVAYENVRTPTKNTDAANKAYVDTAVGNSITALSNDTRFAATNSYKLSSTSAGALIDLGERIAGGSQVFIDVVYNETSSGNAVIHTQLSFSLYGNATSTDARNCVSKQGFGSTLVNAYHTILDNGHDAVWIPKQSANYFPSVVISSAYKNTNVYAVQPTGTPLNISVTTGVEPATTLTQIANKNKADSYYEDSSLRGCRARRCHHRLRPRNSVLYKVLPYTVRQDKRV